MTQRFKQLFHQQRGGQKTLLVWLCLQLIFVLCCSVSLAAQGLGISGANVEASCPASCGIAIRITSAKLRERSDGIDAVIDWTLDQRVPEIKLKNLNVTATVEFNRFGKDEKTVSVPSNQRQAVIRLASGGFNKDIKFSDVVSVKAVVFATADALSTLPINDIRSIKIVGQGGDSAVDVSWGAPTPLACSASTFSVSVKAINEKGDRLDGTGEAVTTARSIRVQLKGDLNKKGLHNPEATVKLQHSLIACQQTTNFPPQLEPLSAGTGSNAPNPVVTLKPIRFTEFSGRIESEIFWEVVEPQGFKATKFDLKVETDRNGNIGTLNRTESGEKRSTRGPDSQVGDGLRSVTITIKATFTNAANTTILIREHKLTQPFTAKSTLPKAEPVKPQQQNLGLNVAAVKINSAKNVHAITVGFQVKPPAGVTITNITVEATALGNQGTAQRSTIVSGQASLANVNFTFSEVGDKLNKVQAKVIANALRADGSTFQQTATAEGQPVAPPPPPPPPPVQLKVSSLSSNNGGLFVNGGWFIEVQPGITIQGFLVEVTILKPAAPVRKSVNVGASVRQQGFSFTTTELSGATNVEMKVTATLRRADGTTFQETSTRQTKP
jgi:hypothetical protein